MVCLVWVSGGEAEERRITEVSPVATGKLYHEGGDRLEVVSSALRILPRKGSHKSRTRRSEGEWRKPRQQFVTTSRMGKYIQPDPHR